MRFSLLISSVFVALLFALSNQAQVALRDPLLAASLGCFAFLALVGFAIYFIIGFHIIPQTEVWIIERLGHFERWAGPGITWVAPWPPWLERIAIKFDTQWRDEDYEIPKVYSQDHIPLTVKLTARFRVQPGRVDPAEKRKLVYLSVDWPDRVGTLLAPTLRDILAHYNALEILGKDQMRQAEIEAEMAHRLGPRLATQWVGLSDTQGILLKNISLPPEMEEALVRKLKVGIEGRTHAELLGLIHAAYPGIPETVVLQSINSLSESPGANTFVVPWGGPAQSEALEKPDEATAAPPPAPAGPTTDDHRQEIKRRPEIAIVKKIPPADSTTEVA